MSDIEHIKEYYLDGSIRYECTISNLSPAFRYLYANRIMRDDGSCFIRINKATKYKKDGSIEWRIIYNDYGQIIGDQFGTKGKYGG